MRMPAHALKANIGRILERERLSNRYRRFLIGLEGKLTSPDYGPDGLHLACVEAMDDPAHEFEAVDKDRFWKELIVDSITLLGGPHGSPTAPQAFCEVVQLWRRSP